jgi:hypothetical protein
MSYWKRDSVSSTEIGWQKKLTKPADKSLPVLSFMIK